MLNPRPNRAPSTRGSTVKTWTVKVFTAYCEFISRHGIIGPGQWHVAIAGTTVAVVTQAEAGLLMVKGRLQGLVVSGVVLLMAGCAQPQYKMVKPGASEEVVMQDDAKCQNQAAMIQVADWEYRGTFAEGANIQMKQNKAYQNCMVGKGYSSIRVQ